MSTMDEWKYREMYDAQCEVIDAIAEALYAHGQPNEVVIERAREMTLRALRAECESRAAQYLCNTLRDQNNNDTQAMRAEIATLQSELRLMTIQRDSMRASADAERANRERKAAQTRAEIKALGAKLRGET